MESMITQYGKITCDTTVTEPRFSGAIEVYKSLHHDYCKGHQNSQFIH